MRLDRWQLIVLAWTALFVGITIAVTIPDYPWKYSFWTGLMKDPTCYYHEMWVVIGTYLWGIAVIVVLRIYSFVKWFLKLWIEGRLD